MSVSVEVLEAIDGGLQATIQDLGRWNVGALGVPVAGACDPSGLAIANLLVDNEAGAAALEVTIAGTELLARRAVVIGLAGANLGAIVHPWGRRLLPGATHRLEAGDRVGFAGTGDPSGSRAYVAVPGGIDVPEVLGSRSTSLVGGFGGLGGRPVRTGDLLGTRAADPAPDRLVGRRWPAELRPPGPGDEVRVLAGRLGGAGEAALRALEAATWQVAVASDRRGLRLEGPPLDADAPADAPSHGVPPGAIQLTPSGQPLVLLRDAGPTGGYPVIAVVATADLGVVGQAGPGAQLRFRAVDTRAAQAAERERRRRLAAGAAAIRGRDPWDDLPGLAGA